MKRLNLATKILVVVTLTIGCVVMINYLRPDTKLIPLKGWESPFSPHLGDAYGILGDAYR